jgi:hypothetical protein
MSAKQYIVYREDGQKYGDIELISHFDNEEEAINSLTELTMDIIKIDGGARQLAVAFVENEALESIRLDNNFPYGLYFTKNDKVVKLYEKTQNEPLCDINRTSELIRSYDCAEQYITTDSTIIITEVPKITVENGTLSEYPYGFYIWKDNDVYTIYKKRISVGTIYNSIELIELGSFKGDYIYTSIDKSSENGTKIGKNGYYIVIANEDNTKLLVYKETETEYIELVESDLKLHSVISYAPLFMNLNVIKKNMPYLPSTPSKHTEDINHITHGDIKLRPADIKQVNYSSVLGQLASIMCNHDETTGILKPSTLKPSSDDSIEEDSCHDDETEAESAVRHLNDEINELLLEENDKDNENDKDKDNENINCLIDDDVKDLIIKLKTQHEKDRGNVKIVTDLMNSFSSTDETNIDEINIDEINIDETNIDETNIDETNIDETLKSSSDVSIEEDSCHDDKTIIETAIHHINDEISELLSEEKAIKNVVENVEDYIIKLQAQYKKDCVEIVTEYMNTRPLTDETLKHMPMKTPVDETHVNETPVDETSC